MTAGPGLDSRATCTRALSVDGGWAFEGALVLPGAGARHRHLEVLTRESAAKARVGSTNDVPLSVVPSTRVVPGV